MDGVKRTEHIGDATLYLGDCLEILPTLGKMDAVVTDPPYGVGKADWDKEYPGGFEQQVIKISDTIAVMPGMWALPKCIQQMGNHFKSVIVGHNLNGMTYGPIGYSNWIPVVVGGKVPNKGKDVLNFTVGSEKKPDHPSPKPLSFMLKLIDRISEPNQDVLDPFMGSGTTGVACAKLGRKFIGIEIDEGYFDIACRRIEEAYRQPDMFIEPPAKATQDAMEFERPASG